MIVSPVPYSEVVRESYAAAGARRVPSADADAEGRCGAGWKPGPGTSQPRWAVGGAQRSGRRHGVRTGTTVKKPPALGAPAGLRTVAAAVRVTVDSSRRNVKVSDSMIDIRVPKDLP